MLTIILLSFTLLGASLPEYTLGLLLSDQNPHRAALHALVPYAVQHFNNHSRGIKLNLITQVGLNKHLVFILRKVILTDLQMLNIESHQTYDPFSLYGLVEAACKLASQVVAVISPDGSHSVASQADILSPLNIPLLSIDATATTLVKSTRKTTLLFSPSDEYQSRAILALLHFYNWREVSILASDTSYGVSGVNSIQHLMTMGAEHDQVGTYSV